MLAQIRKIGAATRIRKIQQHTADDPTVVFADHLASVKFSQLLDLRDELKDRCKKSEKYKPGFASDDHWHLLSVEQELDSRMAARR